MKTNELQSLLESVSLNDNETGLDSKINKYMLNLQKNNINTFKESYVHYEQIIKKYSCLVKQLNLKNSLEVCILFTYLLWNGYFSVTKTNKFTREKTLSVDKLLALDIMRGRGVCIHYSAMLRDFLNVCGYKSACLANIYGNDIDVYFHPDIKRKFGKENKIPKIKKIISEVVGNIYGNHEFNLINESGNLYIYDCTNMVLFNIRSNKKAFIVNGRGKVTLKPNMSYTSNLTNESKDILKLLCKTNEFSNLYTRNYFIDVSNSVIKLLDNNKELLEYYYNLSREDIAFVACSMDEIEQKKIRF